jgi:hypothetical protein
MDTREGQPHSPAAPGNQVETSALYVQLPKPEAEKLDRAAFELKAHKRDLVAALVARHVDPTSAAGLERLRALGVQTRGSPRAEIPPPREPERRPRAPRAPTVQIGRASEWVAGLQRSIRDFARSRDCRTPLVRVTLDEGEQLFLEELASGPADGFVTVSAYEPGDDVTRMIVLHLDAIRKVEILRKPPTAKEKRFIFHPREIDVGFGSGR